LLKQRRLKANQKNLEMEQQLLSAQMNPHFIFNALNSVQAFILEKSAHEASDYLAKFSKLVRLVLNNTREKVLTLEREIEFLRSYIELEQIRFGNKFTVEFVVDESIDTYQVLIPPMLIQPYIENAIWHGLMPLKSERQGKLRVSFTEEERQLTIVIEDNGIGIETSQQIKKSPGHVSTGMTLAETRTKMTGAASVKIYNLQNEDGTPAGTKVEIILTLK
ncbi:MAG TPA: histidine kinase, partial [Bacteroidia bacterium]